MSHYFHRFFIFFFNVPSPPSPFLPPTTDSPFALPPLSHMWKCVLGPTAFRIRAAATRRGVESDVMSHYGAQTCQLEPIKIRRKFFSVLIKILADLKLI